MRLAVLVAVAGSSEPRVQPPLRVITQTFIAPSPEHPSGLACLNLGFRQRAGALGAFREPRDAFYDKQIGREGTA